MPDAARARHAVGMTHRDAAAVDVEPLRIDSEFVAAVEGLRRESLIELPQTDVVDGQPVLLEQFRHREYRPDPHLVGGASRNGHAAVDAERLQSTSRRFGGFHQYRRRRAVGQLRRITGRDGRRRGDGSVGKHRAQTGE
ncbi:Uncharacterised protein [Mycobacteroides abscessus subsp. abscessus]|nr:Uncharacterised protein [Mycobacteroides abscessus subsp. abscessus]